MLATARTHAWIAVKQPHAHEDHLGVLVGLSKQR